MSVSEKSWSMAWKIRFMAEPFSRTHGRTGRQKPLGATSPILVCRTKDVTMLETPDREGRSEDSRSARHCAPSARWGDFFVWSFRPIPKSSAAASAWRNGRISRPQFSTCKTVAFKRYGLSGIVIVSLKCELVTKSKRCPDAIHQKASHVPPDFRVMYVDKDCDRAGCRKIRSKGHKKCDRSI